MQLRLMTPDELIASHRDQWDRAVHHPFLDGVRDGSLPAPAFDLWLEQDYLFVSDLLKFQARLLSLSPRSAQPTLATGLVALVSELDWFEVQARDRGLRLDERRSPVTQDYQLALERLLKAGFDVAVTALWTLERVYLDAWRGALPGAPQYRTFVEHWTPDEFARYVDDLELLAGQGDGAEAAFLEICGLEHRFWEMAWSAR